MCSNVRKITSPWGNEDTQELIDILDQYNVKATFFVVGDWVEKYPESVKALSDASHEVMSLLFPIRNVLNYNWNTICLWFILLNRFNHDDHPIIYL